MPLTVVLVPISLALLLTLLLLVAWIEEHVLHPRSMILAAVKVRSNTPEHVERLVAMESQRLLEQNRRGL